MKRRSVASLQIIILLVLSFTVVMFWSEVVYSTTFASDNFENFTTGWTTAFGGAGAITKSSTVAHGGTYSAIINATANPTSYAYGYNTTAFTSSNHHYQIYVYVPSTVTTGDRGVLLAEPYNLSYVAYQVHVYYNDSDWRLSIGDPSSVTWKAICAIQTDAWKKIDIYYYETSGYIRLFLDNVQQGGNETQGVNKNNNPSRWYIGDISGASSYYNGLIYLDDLFIDEDMTEPSPTVTVSIGEFSAPSRTYSHVWSFWNATVSSTLGNSSLINATLGVYWNGYPSNQTVDIVLLWVNSTNAFSKFFDATGIIEDLNTTRCSSTSINSSAFRLSWCVLVSWNCTLGGGGYPNPNGQSVDLTATNTTVYDSSTNSNSSLSGFTILDNNMKLADLGISDADRTNPLQSLEFSFQVIINWTSGTFDNYTGLSVDLDVIYANESYSGINTTVANIWNSTGYGTIYRDAPSTVANYTYGLSMYSYPQNRWLTYINAYRYAFIVDQVSITFTVDNSSVLAGEYANFTTVFKSVFDNSSIAGLSYGVYRNASLWQTLNANATFSDVHPISTYVFSLTMTANNNNITSVSYSGDLTVEWTGEVSEDLFYFMGFGFLFLLIGVVVALALSKW